MPNPVVHFEIQSNNPEKSREFYHNLFDWEIDHQEALNYNMVMTHGGQGIDGGIGPTGGGQNMVTFYVQVDDLQAYLNKAEKLGGKTIMPVTDIPGVVSFALFADFEGNVVGLVKDMQQAAGATG